MRNSGLLHVRPVQLATLHAASLLVPGERRGEWLREWKSELWYAVRECNSGSAKPAAARCRLTAFCLGSFKDALWLRRNTPRPEECGTPRMKSPMWCSAFLSVLAVISMFVAFVPLTGSQDSVSLVNIQRSFVDFKFVLVFACSILPAITSLSLGELSELNNVLSWKESLRRRAFLSAKVGLILIITYFWSLILTCGRVVFIPQVLQAIGLIWGSAFALRWCLNDQRRRCPVCLQPLVCPVWVGDRSRYFLEWNCTESVCPEGHGLMYVPERPASWFSTQRWLSLDSSWRGLSVSSLQK